MRRWPSNHPPPPPPPCSWDCGETYLIVNKCFSGLIHDMARGINIRTSCPVERVEYGGPDWGVRLHCAGGRKLRCKRVIVTVPLRILQVRGGGGVRGGGQYSAGEG